MKAAQDKRRLNANGLGHLAIILMVFGITGMLAVTFSQLMLNGVLGMDGSIWSGPWSYRLAYVLLVPPFYSLTLIGVGTLFGKHTFFKRRVVRMWRRLLPFRLKRRGLSSG